MPSGRTTSSLQNTLVGIVRLVRPLNFILFFAGVALGGVLAAGSEAFGGQYAMKMVLAMISAALIGGGANAINDVYDLDIDRVNRPDRVLPSGAISVSVAKALWLILSVLGVGLAFAISSLHVGIAVISGILLWAYSAKLKRVLIWGNLAVAMILGLAVFYGGVVPAGGNLMAVGVGVAFAFITTLAREVAKDIEDVEGDSLIGARTMSTVWGSQAAMRVVLAVLFVTLVALPAPVLLGFDPAVMAYLIPAAIALLLSVWPFLTIRSEDVEEVRIAAARSSLWLKVTMVAGIVALVLSQL